MKILEELERNEVRFIANSIVEGFRALPNGEIMGQTHNGPFQTGLVLVEIGIVPEVSLAVETGIQLGAQGIGKDGVVSRINVLAAALTAGLPVQELAYIDLAYAPPFSGSWDPLHIAARKLDKS